MIAESFTYTIALTNIPNIKTFTHTLSLPPPFGDDLRRPYKYPNILFSTSFWVSCFGNLWNANQSTLMNLLIHSGFQVKINNIVPSNYVRIPITAGPTDKLGPCHSLHRSNSTYVLRHTNVRSSCKNELQLGTTKLTFADRACIFQFATPTIWNLESDLPSNITSNVSI